MLCLYDTVVSGPHSYVDGQLINPWTHEGHYAAITPALAYWRFPEYSGYYLVYDDYITHFWNINVHARFSDRPWLNRDFYIQTFDEVSKDNWYWHSVFAELEKEALRTIRAQHAHLISPDSMLANTPDAIAHFSRADGYFIPAALMPQYSDLVLIFTQYGGFLETVVPTVLGLICKQADVDLVSLCQAPIVGQDVHSYWNHHTCDTAHPVKLSHPNNRHMALQLFEEQCSAYRSGPLQPNTYP